MPATLTARRSRQPRVALSPVSPVCVTVPGRARLRVNGLRNHAVLAHDLEGWVGTHGGVVSVRANALTGTLLVIFDPSRLTLRELVNQVVRGVRRKLRPATVCLARSRDGVSSLVDRPACHALPGTAVLRQFETSADDGLAEAQAAVRLADVGPNRLPEPEPRSALATLTDQVTTLPVLLLAAAATMSLASGLVLDAAVILGVVAINAAVGFATERRVEQIIGSLRDMTVPTALVRRDGKDAFLPTAALVPGDIVLLKAGYPVPADGRMVEADGLSVNEAALTGESLPVRKTAHALHPAEAPLAERSNMVYTGTVVSEGTGVAVVSATGPRTEIGRIRRLISEAVAPPTPLERQLDGMGRTLVGLSLGFCGLALGLGVLRGYPLVEMLRTSIALAVAAVPEGLPAVATTTLALGVQRMLRRNALVRRLAAVEGLGATTVICVDKTGTITENRMTVHGWHLGGQEFLLGDSKAEGAGTTVDPRLERALAIGILCNEADLVRTEEGRWEVNGSGTEGALLDAANRAGLDYRRLRQAHPLVSLRPRIENGNWMATVHEAGPGRRLMMVKGAPEEVVRLCAATFDGAIETPLTGPARRAILEANASMANQGMRVLGLAFKTIDGAATERYDELTWAGLVGLTDPIRSGVREAIAACHRAGIRTVMITGDQGLTASAVARELNLVRNGQIRVLEAPQIEKMDEPALRRLAREAGVFARVTPAHKYQIVRALQADGEVVAMTGDGINDGPALKAADIGVAMGARGTEMARELADVVLLDDNFTSIVGAVEQGRTIYTNVGKALRFLLSTNFSEILVTLGALAVGLARPMTAIQFLWINLLSDVFPALALSIEPAGPDVMRRPPRDPAEPILSTRALIEIGTDGALLAATALGAYGIALGRYGMGARASTVAFSTLTSAQLLHALSCRSDSRSSVSDLHRSPAVLGAVGGTLALQVAAVTVPALRRLLGTTPLGAADWALVAGGAVLPLVLKDLRKAVTTGGAAPGARVAPRERRP